MSSILAFDIASKNTGWAFIENGKINKKHLGTIKINPKYVMGKRLSTFEKEICNLINIYKPNIICIENIFKGRNANTFKILSLFRGVAIKTSFEYNGKDPISIMAIQVRSIINLPNKKEEVFCNLNNKYKLGFEFNSDNDVVDAIALGLACDKMIKNGIDPNSLKKKRKRKRKSKKNAKSL